METKTSQRAYKGWIVLCVSMVMLLHTDAFAGSPHGGWERTSLGVRLGWSGGPNGMTLRKDMGNGNAFEFVAGYNAKVGRNADNLPAHKKGNSFVGASYAPYFLMTEGNLGVAFTADIGARLRYHHYRPIVNSNAGWKITPDAIAGLGMQVEFSETVEIFADVHVNYYNRINNVYVPGVESGLGFRITL